jgi:alkylation response protein AidB-like acyl-CoA dehydrogenase
MYQAQQGADALRQELRKFHALDVPASLRTKSEMHQVLNKDDYVQWMQLLQTRGWATGHWPSEQGGLGWSLLQRFTFEDELARLGLPWVIPFGVKYVAPVIYSFGTQAQRLRFLPKIANSEEFWAQGYSEPGAGSDLAAVRTQAVRDGDRYIVNGQKAWTTYAQWADWLFCLVRTSREGRPQNGISFLLIDMKTPGIAVKEIRTMDGYHHVNEVWFENVAVPAENLVGVEGQGWTYAKFLLKNERTAGAIVGWAWHALHRLKKLASQTSYERPAEEQQALLRRIGEFSLRFLALETTAYRAIAAMAEATENGGEAALIKIRGTELHQDIAEATVETLGAVGIAYDTAALYRAAPPPLGPLDSGGIIKDHLYNRAATIFGGTTEIQRNIIAKSVLGL